jgi:hypothetical protein
MSDTKIPEDLSEEYSELKFCAPRDGVSHYMRRVIELIERIARLESELSGLKDQNMTLFALNAFIGERFIQESLRADGRMKSIPAESDLEVALKSQIEICNKERAMQENATRELGKLRAELSLLRGENERLKAPVSQREWLKRYL